MPGDLATAVIAEYVQVKKRFYEGDHKPGSVHGGRCCEAVARVLQHKATGMHTPLADKIDLDKSLNKLENTTLEDSLRLHMVRAMRFVYGVRNSRDTGHLKGGIDTNLQDATVVVATLDWILAELVRVFHGVSAAEANEMIKGIVTKAVPVIEVFNGKPVVHAKLTHMNHVLVVLYWTNRDSITRRELVSVLPPNVQLKRELDRASAKHYVHVDGEEIFLTTPGKKYVEDEKLLHPLNA